MCSLASSGPVTFWRNRGPNASALRPIDGPSEPGYAEQSFVLSSAILVEVPRHAVLRSPGALSDNPPRPCPRVQGAATILQPSDDPVSICGTRARDRSRRSVFALPRFEPRLLREWRVSSSSQRDSPATTRIGPSSPGEAELLPELSRGLRTESKLRQPRETVCAGPQGDDLRTLKTGRRVWRAQIRQAG